MVVIGSNRVSQLDRFSAKERWRGEGDCMTLGVVECDDHSLLSHSVPHDEPCQDKEESPVGPASCNNACLHVIKFDSKADPHDLDFIFKLLSHT